MSFSNLKGINMKFCRRAYLLANYKTNMISSVTALNEAGECLI